MPDKTDDNGAPPLHYISAWAASRGKSQADFVRDLEVGKGTAHRWFSGDLPDAKNVRRIAAYLGLPDPKMLFRSPDEDWIEILVKNLNPGDRDRMVSMLQLDREHHEEKPLEARARGKNIRRTR